ncbi:phosphatidylethanolamine/phosphatidyl-N-methylethanolamine N-methyltransferase [Sphingomonas sp. SORGH_AS802]|nr:phosphatidylethanolamine/phosphatidyl-N-methylethanolamine N-methyltransferase [Sphingomonas sp. SORGH_AS_0438]MDR6135697.1 phosphatidylethanolamine/phosphatidyl-N-methylethanolamine N-methyltransferase [Sphingomonas sp. SORGH_AS_0802]
MATQMNSIGVAKAYDRWAPIYDLVFGAVFRQGRSVAIDAAERVGGRILEVGVGTGISLPRYRRSSRITGVDLSDAMLDKARARVARLGLTNVEAIEIGDAERLAYPDHAFDVVVAQYVVSAVPHPLRALDECARVCRPGGEIVITTRVSAEGGLRGTIERGLMPVTSRLGFRTEFPFSLYSDWVASRPDVTLLEARPIAPFGHFSLVRFGRTAGGKGQDQ